LVLANAIASLEEIAILSGRVHIKVDQQLLSRILVAINECMEWAQVFILDFLSKYSPKDEKEAEMYINHLLRIIDRVIPRLSHINPSVVFSSIRLIVRYLDFLSNEDLIKNLIKKLAPSIVSVVSFTSIETQYVVLKNIQYII
jgi:vesicle coat complex subunit